MKASVRHKLLQALLPVLLILPTFESGADDIEVFFSNNTAPINVLFVLDTSGSMNDQLGGKQKLQIMKDSLKRVLAEDYPGLNVGIMHFKWDASGVDFPVAPIDGESHAVDANIPAGRTVEETLGHIIDSYWADSSTAIVPALHEAYLYLAGKPVRAGKLRPNTWSEANLEYTGGNELAANPASYIPPDAWDASLVQTTAGDLCYQDTYTRDFYGLGEECTAANTFPGSCETHAVGTVTGDTCPGGWVWTPSGESGSWDCPSGLVQVTNTEPLNFCRLNRYGGWREDPVYVSPMVHQCQESYIVLLSDGKPTQTSTTVTDQIAGMIYGPGKTAADCDQLASISNTGIRDNGVCGVDLLTAMADNDAASPVQMPLGKAVKTYTVGFDLSADTAAKDYLKLLANAGNGSYHDADNESDLVTVFRTILTEIGKGNTSFAPPTFTISQANRITFDRDLYLGMFEPSLSPRWPGNVKGYQLTHSGILDVFGHPAVDANGHFIDGTRSYWSSIDDGKEVLLGGLASRLPATRNVYTYTGAAPPAGPVALTATEHRLHETNALLDNTLMGLPGTATTAEREALIQWGRGVDVLDEDSDGNTSETRKELGDPLHSRPVIHQYGSRKVLFTMTNGGFLHAFDVTDAGPSGGNELFAFIPRELLPKLKPLQDNLQTSAKVYGLDGELTAWRPDDTHAYLFLGMRRGGNNYYALDVSNPEAPKLMWVIHGGETGFEQLGQSWSRPSVVRVKHAGTEKPVVLFGGGYDTNQDNVSVRTTDSVGKAVYIVDALTGTLLLTIGDGEDVDVPLTYSIPSDIRAIDLDGNHLVDRLYFGDMGGQLWRVDLDENNIASTTRYFRMADIGGTDAASARRFYYPPSVALAIVDNTPQLAIAMGTGYRAHPLNADIEDRFYVFFDPDVTVGGTTLSSKPLFIEGNLHDATNNPIGEDSSVTLSSALSGKNGWYIRLENNGEKALSAPLIFDKKLFFTTYLPEPVSGGTVDVCSPVQSGGLAYIVNLTNATPAYDFTANGSFAKEDRVVILHENTIPSTPQVVFPKDGDIDTDGDGTPDAPDPNPPPQPASGCSDYTDFWAGKKQTAGGCTPVDRVYWDEQQ